MDEIQPFVDGKRGALASYKSSPCERTLRTLRAARSKVKQISQDVEQMTFGSNCVITYKSVLTGNLKGIYDGIKQAIGSMQS